MKKVGMRNIKTALSVTICVALSQFFYRQYIFYAAIAAVIAMQNSVSDSFKSGKNRMLGTILGAMVGLVFASISPGNTLLCGIGIMIIIYICDLLNWDKSITISCTVFLVIMLSLNGRPPVTYSIDRTIDTFLGIIVAVFVNYFIYPPKYIEKIYRQYKLSIDKVFAFVENKICFNKDIDLNDLNTEILKLEKSLRTYLWEMKITHKHKLKIDNIKKTVSICKEIYEHLKIIQWLENSYGLNEENYLKAKDLFKREFINENKNNDISIVYNYHINKILDNIYILKDIKGF